MYKTSFLQFCFQINTKQRTNLEFVDHLGKTLSQALEILKQVYGNVFQWCKRFKDGNDDSMSGRPSTSRTELIVNMVKQIVHGNRWLTVPMITSQLDLKKESLRDEENLPKNGLKTA